MGRPYTSGDFWDLVQRLTGRRPDICLGADVLVGFPGESDADFEETVQVVRAAPLAYLHVFPFSPRPRTRAANMADQVDRSIAKARTARLRELGREKKAAYQARFVGEARPTLIENSPDPKTGSPRGLTDNYLHVLLPEGDPPAGRIVDVRITGFKDGRLWGRVEG
jgi:threonylcarbamoyladenosine tRNA methylthiotransferase MtaB